MNKRLRIAEAEARHGFVRTSTVRTFDPENTPSSRAREFDLKLTDAEKKAEQLIATISTLRKEHKETPRRGGKTKGARRTVHRKK